MEDTLARLASVSIEILPIEIGPKHVMVARDPFVALVSRTEEGLGSAGTAGLLTMSGVAPLVWRGTEAYFVAKGFEQPASAAEVESLRAFQADLARALEKKI